MVSKINLRTFLGEKHGGRALDLSMPVMIAPMSYGALSSQMKLALGVASHMSGISENSGEGGMLSEERAEARQMIAQCLAGRLGWNVHDVKRADCIEIYISQGAKPGLGGQLMAEKLTREIAAVRGIPAGMDLRSPSRHPDILGGDDLIMKVQEFREATGWRVPISIKLGAGRIRDDIKIALKDGIDFVELDGMQGGTGAAGSEVAEHVGIPTLAGLQEALDGLAEIDCLGRLPIVLMGGIKDGVDAAKAIALGATAVAYGSSMLIAAGCITCMQCSVGGCVIGAATQDPERTKHFDIEKRALQIHRYLESIRWQLASIVHGHGYSDIRQLSRNDLVAPDTRGGGPDAPALRAGSCGENTRDDVTGTGLAVPQKEKSMKNLEVGAEQISDPGNEYFDSEYIPASCQQGCPLGTDIPAYVGLVAQEKFDAAFEVITESNPFPTACGRVCAKPCETQCRRGESDGPIAIRNLKRFVTEQVGLDYRHEPFPVTKSKTVAIVGAGPAGLTAAQDLAGAGYEVHLYEKSNVLGGMMAQGIPPFRLPRRFIEVDIGRIMKRCPGIKVHSNTALGAQASLAELKVRHDAVLLALGLGKDRKLGVPGEKEAIEGLFGIGFLTDVSAGKDIRLEGQRRCRGRRKRGDRRCENGPAGRSGQGGPLLPGSPARNACLASRNRGRPCGRN